MKCPKCEGKVRVMDCVNARNNEVYRKRKCTVCGNVFYTRECVVDPDEEFIEEWYTSYRTNKKEEKKDEV